MRGFGLFFTVFLLNLVNVVKAEESLTIYQQNKQAIGRTAKMYLAFEARHEIGPGVDADLKLPEKAKFRVREDQPFESWVYPIALGLEIKIGTPQKKMIVMAPQPVHGWYLIATEDLEVKAYRKKEIARVLQALEKRRAKLRQNKSQ